MGSGYMEAVLYSLCVEVFLLFTLKEVNVHLPTFWSQGAQGSRSFMSARWSCRSCPLEQQCDLCSANSPFVPRTSIPCQIEAYRTHRFYGEWRKMYAWVWVYVLWLLILTSRSHSGPMEPRALMWGCRMRCRSHWKARSYNAALNSGTLWVSVMLKHLPL